RKAAESTAAMVRIQAEAHRDEAEQKSAATKLLAAATSAQHAAEGLAEAQVLQAKAVATQEQGLAEARILREKFTAEAQGITEKANAMKELDSVGKDHEEFKLRLEKEKQIELAAINAQQSIAHSQAAVLGDALKNAKIDIVGGDGEFFDQISSAVKGGKAIDRLVLSSKVATDIKDTFFTGNPDHFQEQLERLLTQLHLNTGEIKDLSIAALIAKLLAGKDATGLHSQLAQLLGIAGSLDIVDKPVGNFLNKK
ncbi:MAG: flotillin family protein, partial [Planctomycetota bacterium]